MDNISLAKNKFSNNCNCAQAALCGLVTELDEKTLQLIASAFGGGIAQQGKICGAVSGALMALGIKKGYTENGSAEEKAHFYKLANKFISEFSKRHNTTECKELIGYDISVDGEKQKAREEEVFTKKCPRFVGSSVEFMQKIIKEN